MLCTQLSLIIILQSLHVAQFFTIVRKKSIRLLWIPFFFFKIQVNVLIAVANKRSKDITNSSILLLVSFFFP